MTTPQVPKVLFVSFLMFAPEQEIRCITGLYLLVIISDAFLLAQSRESLMRYVHSHESFFMPF